LSARLNQTPRGFPQKSQFVGSLVGAADFPVPDVFPVIPVPAYLAEPNNLALAVPGGEARSAGCTAVTWPPQGVVKVIPRTEGPPARQASVGDGCVEVPVVHGGPMNGTRRVARKARQEKARLKRERKARK